MMLLLLVVVGDVSASCENITIDDDIDVLTSNEVIDEDNVDNDELISVGDTGQSIGEDDIGESFSFNVNNFTYRDPIVFSGKFGDGVNFNSGVLTINTTTPLNKTVDIDDQGEFTCNFSDILDAGKYHVEFISSDATFSYGADFNINPRHIDIRPTNEYVYYGTISQVQYNSKWSNYRIGVFTGYNIHNDYWPQILNILYSNQYCVTFNGSEEYIEKDGNYFFIRNIDIGSYLLNITVTDPNFEGSYTGNIKVIKAETDLSIPSITVPYGVGGSVLIESLGESVSLFDSMYNPFSDNSLYGSLISVDGKNITVNPNLDPGDYKFSFIIDDKYYQSRIGSDNVIPSYFNVKVVKANVTIVNVKNIDVEYGMNDTVYVSGDINTTEFGDIRYGMDLTVTIANKSGNGWVSNDKFNISVSDVGAFEVGEYPIKIEGTSNYWYNVISNENAGILNVTGININLNQVNPIVYGSQSNVTVGGYVDRVKYGSNYTGKINVNITDKYGNLIGVGSDDLDDGTFMVNVDLNSYPGVGFYNIVVFGDDFAVLSVCDVFEVIKADVSLDVNITGDIKVDQHANVSVNLPETATGNVTVTFNNTKYIINLDNQETSTVLPVAPVGTYSVTISWDGDDNYNSVDVVTVLFSVYYYNASDLQKAIDDAILKGESELNLTHDYIFNGNDSVPVNVNASVVINGNNHTIDANQTVAFNITADNVVIKDMNITNTKGCAIISNGSNTSVENVGIVNSTGTAIILTGENATIRDVSLDNVENGIKVNGSGNVTIGGVSVNGGNGTAVIVQGENVNVCNLTLSDTNGTAVIVQGENVNVCNLTLSDTNGTAVIVNAINKNITNVVVNGGNVVPGDADDIVYQHQTVSPDAINVPIFDSNNPEFTIIIPGGDAGGNLTVYDENGNVVGQGFVVNGKGSVKVSSALSPGKYDLSVVYSGDAKYDSVSKFVSVTIPNVITKKATVITAKKKVVFKKSKRSKTKVFKVTLKEKVSGKKLSGKYVLFKLTNVGKIKLSKKVSNAIKKAKIAVKKAKGKNAKVKAKKKLVKVEMPRVMLKQLKKGIYKVKTKNGVAKLILSNKNFVLKNFKGKNIKLTAKFNGDKSYLKSSKTVKVVIK